MRIACLLLLMELVQVIVGCGQKGPLVLPDAQRPHKRMSQPTMGQPTPPASATPQPAAPAGLPSATPAPTDPTATGEATRLPAPPQ